MQAMFSNDLDTNVDSYVKRIIDNVDDMIMEFLNRNGYIIKDKYDIKRFNEIVEQLKEEDKFVDYISFQDFTNIVDGIICHHTIIPFFNSISHPLSKKDKELIIERYRNENNR